MKTILVVDDEENILKMIRSLLRKEYEVLIANGGKTALALLKENQVDLILSDQRMPEMTGVQFLAQARTLQPQAVRVLMTAFSDIQAVIDAINVAGVYKYIQKPWDPDELLNMLRGSFAQHVPATLGDRPHAPAVSHHSP